MIKLSGIEITPGNLGQDCLGNGEHLDQNGKKIKCLCGSCDYCPCCIYTDFRVFCSECERIDCPRVPLHKT